MQSMTGFGKGSARFGEDCLLNVELSSVNRKQLEIRVAMPPEWSGLESEARKSIAALISRGALQLRVSVGSGDGKAGCLLNRALLDTLIVQCMAARKRHQLDAAVEVERLLSVPGVLGASEIDPEDPELQAAFHAALDAALTAFNAMRRAEGEHLKLDCRARLEILKSLLAKIRPVVEGIPGQLKAKLLEKLAAEKLPVDLSDDRLLKEVLFYADKADVTEEITRLNSHFAQFEGFLESGEPVGRSLDFLIQEMFREITTLGNKAAVPAVSPHIIAFKSELEKLREQIQNVE